MRRTARRVLLGLVCGTVVCALLAALADDGLAQSSRRARRGRGAHGGPVPVVAAKVVRRNIPFTLSAIGNVEPYSTVAVKARVDGQIVAVGFKEGQEVRRGSVLFKIDPRPFQAALRQAEATHARDIALRDQARSQERRYKELLHKNFVSKEAYAQMVTNVESADAVAMASRAAVESAKLNLSYCTIRSPIDGYTGKIQITRGNLVKANDSVALVIVNQVHPIYVRFSVPEQRLDAIRSYLARGPITVQAASPNSKSPPAAGKLVFIDNTVDSSTGMIQLRAIFDNSNNALWPGQFVNVSLKLYEQKNAVVVPTQAIQTGPDGEFVFVIKRDMTTAVRKIVVDRTDGNDTIIAKGLSGGERVVISGQLRLAPGTKVTIKG